MGFFRRREQLAVANVALGWNEGDDWRSWPAPRNFVVGESYRRAALRRLTGPARRAGYLIPVEVVLIRERENQHDGNAIRAEVAGQHVGYLARHIAAQLAPVIDRAGCARFSVCGLLRGGSDIATDVGVHVWLDRRLTAGPGITLGDAAGTTSWPPGPAEGVYCSADDAAG